MPRRVQFSRLGGPEVLEIVEVPEPHPGPGEVRVRVRTAGLNPLDAKIFQGRPTSSGQGVDLPSGNGHDFAGTVDELGEGVTALAVGDEVFGQVSRAAHADFVVIAAEKLVRKPPELGWDIAGALSIAARTASASVESLDLSADDTVFVSAAAGGVGVLASQLARRTGATVIGSARRENHPFLESIGVIPVEYGPGLVDALKAHAPITAALDNHGRESVDAALAAGVPPARLNTIADYAAAADYGATRVGGGAFVPGTITGIATLIADGELAFPIDAVFPFERVGDAYSRLLGSHGPGKIVLEL
jgi:enoyl reductase